MKSSSSIEGMAVRHCIMHVGLVLTFIVVTVNGG